MSFGKNENNWETILSSGINTLSDLSAGWSAHHGNIEQVTASYPMRINAYFMSLIDDPEGPLGLQVIPNLDEIENQQGFDDPLDEEGQSPVPCLIHRYPDRVVLLVSNQCAVYCRFCLRKRHIGVPATEISMDVVNETIDYIRHHEKIKEVILSGGEPLLLFDGVLEAILSRIRSIPSVRIIRIHTRIPSVLPQRITKPLSKMLSRFHPLFINTHFNHPDEITPESTKACSMLVDEGIPLGCQTVLLKGVNDDPETMKKLMVRLLETRIRPYYIHQLDQIKGTCHFSVPLSKGMKIIEALRGHIPGIGVPQFMIDLPGGGGKIPLSPSYIKEKGDEKWIIRNFKGDLYEYPLILESKKGIGI